VRPRREWNRAACSEANEVRSSRRRSISFLLRGRGGFSKTCSHSTGFLFFPPQPQYPVQDTSYFPGDEIHAGEWKSEPPKKTQTSSAKEEEKRTHTDKLKQISKKSNKFEPKPNWWVIYCPSSLLHGRASELVQKNRIFRTSLSVCMR